MSRRFLWVSALGVLALLVLSVELVLTAANSVSTSGASNQSNAVTIAQLAPPECASIALGDIEYVSPGVPLVSTGSSNDLILGTSGADTITARKGQDCVVGGGGNDSIDGNQGNDILLGGPGDDDLDGGQGNDVCYGGGGSDTFRRCESTP